MIPHHFRDIVFMVEGGIAFALAVVVMAMIDLWHGK
jgi:hypothetical protein